MKIKPFYLFALVLSLVTAIPLCSVASTPFIPELQSYMTANDANITAIRKGSVTDTTASPITADGQRLKQVAVATYDFAVHGGAISAIPLGVYLPAGAIITRSYLQVITQMVDGGSGTIAFSCEDANNIKTATDITGSTDGAFIEGQSTGAASAFVSGIAARCQITATIAGAVVSAGKVKAIVEYTVGG